ncbi:DUF2767 family protein [Duffyella gerundensis]|uniref:DUF2767 family protein n=1 Tax=Duffyella gerundensis TaxID=1619313 RepID=UPI001653F5B0|nr:DUF2767 family protein [Duffyella gerundensis]
MSDHFDAFNTGEHYGVLCTIVGDAIFNLHREGEAVSEASIIKRLAHERRNRNDKFEDKFYEMAIRVLSQ